MLLSCACFPLAKTITQAIIRTHPFLQPFRDWILPPRCPFLQVSIDESNSEGVGEILAKGDNVMLGYNDLPIDHLFFCKCFLLVLAFLSSSCTIILTVLRIKPSYILIYSCDLFAQTTENLCKILKTIQMLAKCMVILTKYFVSS